MTYTMSQDDTSLVVRIMGRLDATTSPELEDALMPRLEGIESLTLDLAGVDLVSSMGLRLLLAINKRMSKQGAMRISGAQGQVLELFEDTGFAEIFTLV